MRLSTSFIWIAIACSACSESASSQGKAAPAKELAQAAPAAPAPSPPAPVPSPPAPALATCTRGKVVEYYEASGATATACLASGDSKLRDCWRIDAAGTAAALPESQWPAVGSGRPQGDRVMPVEIDNALVQAPAPLKVKLAWPGGDAPPAIEICNGGACKRVQTRAPQPAIVGSLRSVTVHPDGHTVFAGFGDTPEGDQAIERYDLDQPAAAPRRLDHPGGCAEILGVFAGKLLVQTTGCIENTGARVLMTPSGRIVANLGTYVLGEALHALGSDRWLFEGHESFTIWDLAAGKRVAIAKGGEHFGRRAALIGGSIVAVDGDGALMGYNAKLERRPLGAIPRCP